MKYILVTGGVMSGIGKGIVTSSIGALLKACDIKVTAIKIDPYINIDAGTFSPYEHGEVFVLDDGCEVDLDLGNYERFLDVKLKAANNITTGKIYQLVINKERKGDFLGKTVQIVPHITDAIQEWIENTANDAEAEVCLIELGGTVGDIEGMPFIEALRQLKRRVKKDNFCCCHVNFVPCIGPSKEQKTKPTQASVKTLSSLGLHPDMIVCRCEVPISDQVREKISNFCDVETDFVFSLADLKTIYRVPWVLQQQGIIEALSDHLKIDTRETFLGKWESIMDLSINAKKVVTIALVGKYTALRDCYTSVIKSLEHASFRLHSGVEVRLIDSEALEGDEDNQAWRDLKSCSGLVVPGGFGIRGVEGKINAIRWARENKVPFLGICLGFQLAVVEYARNVMSITNAHSAEFESSIENMEPVVIEMLEYLDEERRMGGTMRLGLRKTKFTAEASIARQIYDERDAIEERHRHRYEINPKHIAEIEKAGLRFVGKNEDETRMEVLELPRSTHPYFFAVQYHPEYLSRPFNPSPPFFGLVDAARLYAELPDCC